MSQNIDSEGQDLQTIAAGYHLQELVATFHDAKNVSPCTEWNPALDDLLVLDTAAEVLHNLSKHFEEENERAPGVHNQRYLRAHLLLEELSEVLSAMAQGNRIELLDGLADLLYVLLGTAATYRLRLPEAFDRVHRSNMTKAPRRPNHNDPRLREKGLDYKEPRFDDLL